MYFWVYSKLPDYQLEVALIYDPRIWRWKIWASKRVRCVPPHADRWFQVHQWVMGPLVLSWSRYPLVA